MSNMQACSNAIHPQSLNTFMLVCSMQITGGRNGYGAKLTNIFSTEFVIETCDGKRQRKYKQVSNNNTDNHVAPIVR